MSICGIFAAGIFACREAKKTGYDDTDMIALLLVAGLGALIGGHLLYGLIRYQNFPWLFEARGVGDFFGRLSVIFGGQVFYGGLLGGLASGLAYGKRKFRDKFTIICDIAVPVIPLFHFFGRIGCFTAGCCFGIESEYGFTFTRSIISQANGINRLPVQLIESAFNLCLFGLLWFLQRRAAFHKKILFLYLLIYPAGRFVLEFFRGDAYRGFWGPLSTSQWISLILIFSALFFILKKDEKIDEKIIVLVGPKHSGKTSAGKALAEKLGCPFYDLDACIEQKTGKSPRTLYSEGEAVFRRAEAETLRALLVSMDGNKARLDGAAPADSRADSRAVLAAGGGIIDNPEAFSLLGDSSFPVLVYLELDAATAWSRISASPLPPFLVNGGNGATPRDTHRLLHEKRAKAYKAAASITIEAGAKRPEAIAGEICDLLEINNKAPFAANPV
jgi:phosphatidylglycerol:prolipoprotein diacylglycerol transferase